MATTSKLPFINRELSWLAFNERILEQAQDQTLPLLERLKFLAISASNLDEFFMVRVGGLQMLVSKDVTKPDPSGLPPIEQLESISKRVHTFVINQHACYLDDLEKQLAAGGIRRVYLPELTQNQSHHIEYMFDQEIFPILSPIAVTPPYKFPLLPNRALHIAIRLKNDGTSTEQVDSRYAIIPVGKVMSRFITLPAEGGYHFMLLEDIIHRFVNRFFPGETILECIPFRITRNADLGIREDLAFDLMAEMESVLDARKRSDCVRLEVSNQISSPTLSFLQQTLEIDNEDTYQVQGPLDFASFMQLTDLPGYRSLKNEPWSPQPSPVVEPTKPISEILSEREIVLFHPYESFEPVIRFVSEAADDPDVITIKIILYRTSRNSPIISALKRAAEKGKYVTAMVELKARFDEERNIEWARELEDAGVQVLYGVKGLKTHAKVCLIIRRSTQGLVRHIHFGTGNYNEATARMYSDVSFLTSDEDLGNDASGFFNAITGYSQPQRFRKIESAPIGLRDKLLELIENEITLQSEGNKGLIRAKMNSLADPVIIAALYRASQAGVKVHLNIRGICCLKPGIKGISDKITVISIVDRFLEHSRILHFHCGGDDRLYITTADWMPRNLDRRIELLVPIETPPGRKQCIEILDTCFRDNSNAWKLHKTGAYTRVLRGRKKTVRCQEVFFNEAQKATTRSRKVRQTSFEPYRPVESEP